MRVCVLREMGLKMDVGFIFSLISFTFKSKRSLHAHISSHFPHLQIDNEAEKVAVGVQFAIFAVYVNIVMQCA